MAVASQPTNAENDTVSGPPCDSNTYSGQRLKALMKDEVSAAEEMNELVQKVAERIKSY